MDGKNIFDTVIQMMIVRMIPDECKKLIRSCACSQNEQLGLKTQVEQKRDQITKRNQMKSRKTNKNDIEKAISKQRNCKHKRYCKKHHKSIDRPNGLSSARIRDIKCPRKHGAGQTKCKATQSKNHKHSLHEVQPSKKDALIEPRLCRKCVCRLLLFSLNSRNDEKSHDPVVLRKNLHAYENTQSTIVCNDDQSNSNDIQGKCRTPVAPKYVNIHPGYGIQKEACLCLPCFRNEYKQQDILANNIVSPCNMVKNQCGREAISKKLDGSCSGSLNFSNMKKEQMRDTCPSKQQCNPSSQNDDRTINNSSKFEHSRPSKSQEHSPDHIDNNIEKLREIISKLCNDNEKGRQIKRYMESRGISSNDSETYHCCPRNGGIPDSNSKNASPNLGEIAEVSDSVASSSESGECQCNAQANCGAVIKMRLIDNCTNTKLGNEPHNTANLCSDLEYIRCQCGHKQNSCYQPPDEHTQQLFSLRDRDQCCKNASPYFNSPIEKKNDFCFKQEQPLHQSDFSKGLPQQSFKCSQMGEPTDEIACEPSLMSVPSPMYKNQSSHSTECMPETKPTPTCYDFFYGSLQPLKRAETSQT